MKLRHLRAALIAAAVIPVFNQGVRAATVDLIWNVPSGGAANWDTNSTQDWSSNGTSNDSKWTSSGSERANFTVGTAGTVTIVGGVTAYGLNFGLQNYNITGAALTLAGPGGPIFSNLTETISAPIAGVVGLTKTGSGTLNLTGPNTYSGGTTIYDSTIVGTAQAAASPFSSGAVNLNMGALNLKGIASPTTTTIGNLTAGTAFDNSNGGGTGVSNVIIDSTATGATTLAAGNLVRGGVGSVLAITPVKASLGTNEVLTFTGGTTLTNNILPAWVVAQTSSTVAAVDFVTYGGSGVVPATYSASDVTASSNSDTVNENAAPLPVTTDVSAYALKTNQAIDLGTHTLNIGNGSGQSGLILNGGSVTNGNINFGSTEGMIYLSGTSAIGSPGTTITSNALTITASGATTATFNGNIVEGAPLTPVQITSSVSPTTIVLNGNNSYTGGTVLAVNTGSGGNIVLGNDSAFGSGKVTIDLVPGTSSPQLQASGGTRTIANAMDLNGGLVFTGTNSFLFSGPINIINAQTGGARTIQNTISNSGGANVTFGSSGSPSTITLGNPVANGGDGVGKTLTIGATAAASANTTTIINDVIQDPAPGGGAASGSVQYLGGNPSLIQINSLNTYTGQTILGGTTNAAIQFNHDSGGTSGPFGADSALLVFNNTSNNQLQPTGGNRTIANPISLVFGWTISNATGDTTSGLTFTGAIAETNAGRTLGNNLAATNTLVVGSVTSPTTLTLSSVSGQGTTINGSGNTIFNDSINDFNGSTADNLTVSATGTTTFNGNISSNGNLSITGGGTEIFNGVRSGPGNTTSTGTFTFSSATGGIVTLNTQNSYSGANSVTTSAGLLRIGASSDSVTSPTKGPLGTGTITTNQGNAPPQFQAVNADQMISNPMTLSSGFIVSTGAPNFSLTFAGAISPAAGKTITNNTVLAKPFVLGDPTSPSTITLAGSLAFQTNNGSTSSTVINDAIVGASGALTAQNNAIVLVKGQASYGGTTTVQSTTNNTPGQSLTFTKSLTSSPTINITSGKLTMASDGSHNVVLKTNTLTISTTGVGTAPPGKLDLTDNKLVVHGGSPGTPTFGTYNGIQGLVQSGRNGGGWNGTAGIITSASTTSSGRELTTLGVALNSDLGTPRTTFGGVTGIASNDVLVMYTYAGDADLNGVINGDDYARIDAAFGGSPLSGGVGYENGDFNYDGKIDADDYFLIDSNYAAQGNPISAGPGIGGAAPLGLSGVSAVPEPGSLGVGLVSLGFYFGTRRRKQR